MITPLFEITQNDDFVLISIKAPFAKVSDAEVSIESKQFVFVSKPYFLRIFFSKELEENGQESATYEEGMFTVKVPKKNVGEVFPDLNFITKLLTPNGSSNAKPLIEEVEVSDDLQQNLDIEHVYSNEWYSKQEISPATCSKSSTSDWNTCYGFACQRHGVFTKLREELWNLVDITDPDNLTLQERIETLISTDKEKFNADHYLADFFDSENIDLLISFVCPWNKQSDHTSTSFTEDEKYRMKELPKRTYSLDEKQQRNAMLSLVDILYAYAYNFRTNEGEHNCESGWLITKLSPTLSHLINWSKVKDLGAACLRRSLCYPLYRNWKLSIKVWDDVKNILLSSKTVVLKCLLDIHCIFANAGDYRYILNDLYITDYCVWLQSVDESVFRLLAEDISQEHFVKSYVDLDLDTLELAGQLAVSCEIGTTQINTTDDVVQTEKDLLNNIQLCIASSYAVQEDSDDSVGLED